ncbi:MAG: PrsW family intramembrane metalloprotease [Actinomycetota bacterium]|nr:PrsW family intramembrane metalloprotease [Actinomycetota bacterium]
MTSDVLHRPENVPVRRERGPARGPRRWPLRWVAVLLTGCGLIGLVLAVLVNTRNPIFVPTLLLLGAAVLPATVTTLVTELGPRPGLSLSRLAVAAVLGGVVGGVLAGWLEFDTARALGSLPYLMIGLIEESAKLAVALLLFVWLRPRPRAADGLVIGVAVGSGFAAMETMGYAFVALIQSHGALLPVDHLLMARALVGLGGHAAWTGLACAAWFARYGARRPRLADLRFLAVFAAVVCLHAQWDASAGGIGYRLLGAAGVTLLAATTAWLHYRERATGRVPLGHPHVGAAEPLAPSTTGAPPRTRRP